MEDGERMRVYSLTPDLHGDTDFLLAPECDVHCWVIEHEATRTVMVGDDRVGGCRCHRVEEDCPDDAGLTVQVPGGYWWHIMPPCRSGS